LNIEDIEARFERIEKLITEDPKVKEELGKIFVENTRMLSNIFGQLVVQAQHDLGIVVKNALADTLKRKDA